MTELLSMQREREGGRRLGLVVTSVLRELDRLS